MLKDLQLRLRMANNRFTIAELWNKYCQLYPEKVSRHSKKEEKDALTNIIQLVRFALHQISKLESLYPTANRYFSLWCGQLQRQLSEDQKAIISQVVRYIASNGSCSVAELKQDDKTYAAQLIRAFGGKDQANEALTSLARFIIFRKTA